MVFRARSSKESGPSGTEEERRRYAQMDKILRDHGTCIASDDPRLKGNRHLLREPTDDPTSSRPIRADPAN
jgi:hypothetical protein